MLTKFLLAVAIFFVAPIATPHTPIDLSSIVCCVTLPDVLSTKCISDDDEVFIVNTERLPNESDESLIARHSYHIVDVMNEVNKNFITTVSTEQPPVQTEREANESIADFIGRHIRDVWGEQ